MPAPLSKGKGKAALPKPKSDEMVQSSDEEDDSVDSSNHSDTHSDADSEDLEAITPRKNKPSNAVASGSGSGGTAGKSFPKYHPPRGLSVLQVSSAFKSSPFEWDAIASKPGVELWTVRVPKDVKPSRLASLSVTMGSNPSGSLRLKSQSYKLVPAGSSNPARAEVDEEGRQPTAGPTLADAMAMDVDADEGDLRIEGGEEMEGMRLLVPKVQGGKLYIAPIPVTRRFLLSPDVPPPEPTTNDHPLPSFLSTVVPNSTTTVTTLHPETALRRKRKQPSHLLKFRNHAYGFDTPGPLSETVAAVASNDVSKAKEKKRKSVGHDQSPKKKKANA